MSGPGHSRVDQCGRDGTGLRANHWGSRSGVMPINTEIMAPGDTYFNTTEEQLYVLNSSKTGWNPIAGGSRFVDFVLVDSGTAIAVGDGILAFAVPLGMNGMNLNDVVAIVHTPGGGGGPDMEIQVRRRRAGVDADMLTTRVSVSDGEYFARDGVIDPANDDIQTGDQIYVDVDSVNTNAPQGLSVTLSFGY